MVVPVEVNTCPAPVVKPPFAVIKPVAVVAPVRVVVPVEVNTCPAPVVKPPFAVIKPVAVVRPPTFKFFASPIPPSVTNEPEFTSDDSVVSVIFIFCIFCKPWANGNLK